jgi:murein DD-endopeptidase MepM/ murein hydrolase activator NlpD
VLRSALLALCISLCAALFGAAPVGADADPVASFNEVNEQLAQLLLEREALELSISHAMAAERAELARLDAAEGTLARLVGERRANDERRAEIVQRIAFAEAQAPALESHAQAIERQVDAHERWILDGETPRLRGSVAYRSALSVRDQLSDNRASVLSGLTEVRASESAAVVELGRLNTEIGFWERQADALSRQVGVQRGRALGAHARLTAIQKEALELVGTIRDQVTQLRRLGYPIGAGFAAEGLAPVAPPVEWPAAAPRGYVVPAGSSSPALRGGEPLRADPGTPLPPSLPAVKWTVPVRGTVTTPFGDSTPYQPAHWAIDIGARLYEPVRASADGVVEFAGLAAGDNRLASYGMVIAIRHDERLTTLYAHLDDRAYGALVQPGETVRQGQVIGYVGLTGNSTGPHVHFEARLDGRPFDPLLLTQ